MRKYRSVDGKMAATMERIPYSRGEYIGSHIYTEVEGADMNSHRYNWEVTGDFAHAFEWLVKEFGCGWVKVRN